MGRVSWHKKTRTKNFSIGVCCACGICSEARSPIQTNPISGEVKGDTVVSFTACVKPLLGGETPVVGIADVIDRLRPQIERVKPLLNDQIPVVGIAEVIDQLRP